MSDIKFRLSTDNRDFKRGLDDARKQAGGFSDAMDDVGKKLNRTFGAGDVFKGLLQGLGIGSGEKIAEFLVTPFRKASEYAKEFLSQSDRAASAIARLFSLKRSDEENLDVMKKEEASLQKQSDEYSRRTLNAEDAAKAETVKADLSEKSLAIAELEEKIRANAASKAKELAAAKAQVADKERSMIRGAMEDEWKRFDLLEESKQLYQDAQFLRDDDVEKQKLILRSLDLANEANQLSVKIEEDKAKAAEKTAEKQKKQTEEAKKLAKELDKAKGKLTEAKDSLRDSRREQFTFTLADAAEGKRGGPAGKRRARLIEQKDRLARNIIDQGDYEVNFDDEGMVTLSSQNPARKDAAKQATGRVRKLIGDREGIRQSIGGLSRQDQAPLASEIKAVEAATKEVVSVLEEIRDSKFANE